MRAVILHLTGFPHGMQVFVIRYISSDVFLKQQNLDLSSRKLFNDNFQLVRCYETNEFICNIKIIVSVFSRSSLAHSTQYDLNYLKKS
jgi:hypothetical protein